ncbi:MAG: methylmalonyl-CoA mutase, partial [Nitrospirae bacterium CG_4_9_14_3_um_filter_51_5]
EKEQVDRLRKWRQTRNQSHVIAALALVRKAAASGENVMPCLLDAVKAQATLGEICTALQEVFGTYQEPVVL